MSFQSTRGPQKRAYTKPRPSELVDEPVKRSLLDEKAKKAKLLDKQKRREERKVKEVVVEDEEGGSEQEEGDEEEDLDGGSDEEGISGEEADDLDDLDEEDDEDEEASEDDLETSNPTADPIELEDDTTFASLGLIPELVKATTSLSFTKPTPIQARSLPPALAGKDIIGLAQTGSGKTAAFLLPILQSLFTSDSPSPFYALVLAPTRELAYQIDQTLKGLGAGIGVRSTVLVGGMDMMQQSVSLGKRPHVIVATPGRLMDHLENTKGFSLRNLKYLVSPPRSLPIPLENKPCSSFPSACSSRSSSLVPCPDTTPTSFSPLFLFFLSSFFYFIFFFLVAQVMDEADRLLDLDFGPILDKILKVIPKDERRTYLFSATMTTKVAKLQRASLKDPVRVEVSSK